MTGLLHGGETMDYFARRKEKDVDGKKPGWGEYQQMFDVLGPDGAQEMSDEPGVPIGDERTARLKDAMAWLRGRE